MVVHAWPYQGWGMLVVTCQKKRKVQRAVGLHSVQRWSYMLSVCMYVYMGCALTGCQHGLGRRVPVEG